jgi:hypothetical protein
MRDIVQREGNRESWKEGACNGGTEPNPRSGIHSLWKGVTFGQPCPGFKELYQIYKSFK